MSPMPHGYIPPDNQLRRVEVENFSIVRPRRGRPKKLVKGQEQAISERDARRIEKLVIPPAWRDVRISADPRSHIQAVGRDEAGRRQYIYHEEWEAVRSADKAERLRRLITALPRLRRRIARDLDQQGDRRVLATAARLVDRLCFRAGHEAYAGEESGRGAATLLCKHVRVEDGRVEFDFPGKGKRRITATLMDRKVARNISEARQSGKKRLFTLSAEAGQRNMTATDLNAYLTEIAACDISAKDFRTLRASSMAISHLIAGPKKTLAARRRNLARVCRDISRVLFNTPAVVRRSYVHAPLLSDYETATLVRPRKASRQRGCREGENLLLAFLRP